MEWKLGYKASAEWTQGNTYMSAYLSKLEKICSQAMKHALWESIEKKNRVIMNKCAQ